MTTGHSFFGAYRVILLAAILTGSLAGSLFGQAPDPLKWNVDKSLFPKAYGLLANEHLLYPVDQSNWPGKIDRRRQLFLDD